MVSCVCLVSSVLWLVSGGQCLVSSLWSLTDVVAERHVGGDVHTGWLFVPRQLRPVREVARAAPGPDSPTRRILLAF